ncbi:hypothetical protein D3C76_1636630 [compost metagenome]
MADPADLAADVLMQPFQWVQQGDKATVLTVYDRFEGEQRGDKLALAFKGDFHML